MTRAKILLLDDNPDFAGALRRGLRGAYEVDVAQNVDGAREAITAGAQLTLVDVVLDESSPSDRGGLRFVEWIAREHPDLPVVVLTGHGDDEIEVEALRLGAADYVEKEGLNLKLLRSKIEALLERRALQLRARELESRLQEYEPHALIGSSGTICALRNLILQLAGSDATVFIAGESGVGKEVVARALHQSSVRRAKPFVAVNCAALSGGLLESELFGHEKGAFTSAHERRIGMFEKASGGTLLLDEVTEIDASMQAKLLRALETKQIQRVGSSNPIDLDVRIIATTNRSPEGAVADGRLRQDLFYRLNVLRVEVPPLRQHPEDIPELASHFLERLRHRGVHPGKRLSPVALKLLFNYSWPGNVRELGNVVERAFTLCQEDEIPATLVGPWLAASPSVVALHPTEDQELDLDSRTALTQLHAIADALSRAHGVKHEAQRLLGIADRSTFRRRVRILRRDFPDLWTRFPILEKWYGGSG